MNKKLKPIICVLLCAVICFSFSDLFASRVEADGTTTIAEDKEELKRLKARLQAIKQAKNDLSDSKAAAGEHYENAYAEKLVIENEISVYEDEIRITEKLVAEIEDLISKLTVEMYEQTEKIDKLYEAYDKIVLYYYKNGNATELELLMGSESISAFLTKKDYVNYILGYMNTIAEEIDGAKLDLENTRSVYETSYKDLNAYKKSLDDAIAEQTKRIEDLNLLMNDITGDITLTDSQIDEYNRTLKNIENEINELNKVIEQKYQYMESGCGWPIDSLYWKDVKITSPFGNRKDPFTGKTEFHNGYDFAAPKGTPVQSVKAGTVTRSRNESGYGEVIVVTHSDGTSTLYAHLSKRLVEVGDKVLQNQVIGKVGSTGRSTGNHLHFTVYDGGSAVDPGKFLDKYIKKALDKYGYLD